MSDEIDLGSKVSLRGSVKGRVGEVDGLTTLPGKPAVAHVRWSGGFGEDVLVSDLVAVYPEGAPPVRR